MDFAEILIGQIPEAIFFALFMIYTKNIKEKRLIFILLSVFNYIVLKSMIHYNIWFQVLFTIIECIDLKVLYKNKGNVTDIFTFSIASIVVIIISVLSYMIIWKTLGIYAYAVILNRILLALFLIVFHNKLYKINGLYKLLWNRNDKVKKKIKSTTFRALNITVFNILFYIINLGMLFMIIQNGGV